MPIHIEDLSHPIAHKSPAYPNDPLCRFTKAANLDEVGYNLTHIALSSHQGTHLDAPSHFLPKGTSVDEIPLSNLWGRACCIDLRKKGKPDDIIDVSDLIPYASYFTPKALVLLSTGWDEVYYEPVFFHRHPSFSIDAARWIAERKIGLLGLDLPSPARTHIKEVHQQILGANICLVESLKGLTELINRDFYFAAIPLPLQGVDGSPVRAIAFWTEASEHKSRLLVKMVTTPKETIDALTIRDRVFIEEQGIDPKIERDSHDRDAIHFIAYHNGQPLGAARLLITGKEGKIGRMAVVKEARGQGIGSTILSEIIETSRNIGLDGLYLHAQTHAKNLYLHQGFIVSSEIFFEAGIPHVLMRLELN